MKTVVLIGGGHSHWIVLKRAVESSLGSIARFVVLSDTAYPFYSGMIPGLIAGYYQREACCINLVTLCRDARAEFFHERVTRILHSADGGVVECESGASYSYDIASINVGCEVRPVAEIGSRMSIGAKPLPELLKAIDDFSVAAGKSGDGCVIIGAGAAGFELACALRVRLGDGCRVVLASRGQRLLPGYFSAVSKAGERVLDESGIEFLRQPLSNYLAQHNPAMIIRATGAMLPGWLAESALTKGEDGFLSVTPELLCVGYQNLFAAGDVASVVGAPRQKSGVYAVRHGRVLAENMHRLLSGKSLNTYTPQKSFLSLLNCCDGSALCSRMPFSPRSWAAWFVKDRIDRKFLAQFPQPAIVPVEERFDREGS